MWRSTPPGSAGFPPIAGYASVQVGRSADLPLSTTRWLVFVANEPTGRQLSLVAQGSGPAPELGLSGRPRVLVLYAVPGG